MTTPELRQGQGFSVHQIARARSVQLPVSQSSRANHQLTADGTQSAASHFMSGTHDGPAGSLKLLDGLDGSDSQSTNAVEVHNSSAADEGAAPYWLPPPRPNLPIGQLEFDHQSTSADGVQS